MQLNNLFFLRDLASFDAKIHLGLMAIQMVFSCEKLYMYSIHMNVVGVHQ